MKKSTLQSLVSYLNGNAIDNLDEIREELNAELNRGAEKAQANRELYALAHDVAMSGLERSTNGVTAGELYEEIADELPEGFSKGKLQYALSRLWNDELNIVKEKGANLYALKA